MTGYPIRDRLGEIACPMLVVWGGLDRLVPVRDAHEFEWLIPQARKIVHADTGHLVMLERPARFNADLRAFLDEGRRRGGRRRVAYADEVRTRGRLTAARRALLALLVGP